MRRENVIKGRKLPEHRINKLIIEEIVKVVDFEGKNLGNITKIQALSIAQDAGMDLVEIFPKSETEPPICKILNYGAFLYHNKKKQAASRKASKPQKLKTVEVGIRITSHDFETKISNVKNFISEGDKAKFSVKFTSKEMRQLQQEERHKAAMAIINRALEETQDTVNLLQQPSQESRSISIILGPKSQKD